MPRYDYKCTACDNEFELVQKFSEAGQGECPICGGAGQRVFHAVPVIYKGSGFYTTDTAAQRPRKLREPGILLRFSRLHQCSSSSGDTQVSDAARRRQRVIWSAAPAAAGSDSA